MVNYETTRKKRITKRMVTQRIFYYSLVGIPLIQFCIFYIYVNFDSFAMAFETLDIETGVYSFYGIKNFEQLFIDFRTQDVYLYSLLNSLKLYVFGIIFGVPVGIVFSYYIFKKCWGGTFFKVLLYVPSIVPSVVTVAIFKYFMDTAVPEIIEELVGTRCMGLLSNPDTRYVTILAYNIILGWGGHVLIYSSTMSGISDSMIESAQLDGITTAKEILYIVLPSIWPTFTTFIVVGISSIFTNQMSLYTFYGPSTPPDLYTFGYYLYTYTVNAGPIKYPYLSALGMLMTMVAVPLTLLGRHLLNKYGPSAD